MFAERFCDRVESGAKRHTIRRVAKRPIAVGDDLSLRRWAAKPYRSKQVVIRNVVCTKVSSIVLTNGEPPKDCWGQEEVADDPHAVIDGVRLDFDQCDALAEQDGFASFSELMAWHDRAGGLPFEGVLIEWVQKVGE